MSSKIPTRQTAFDYDRTVVAFHGTRKSTAAKLVKGEAFGPSTNDDDWLGHGIYFWEYAPQQAWAWATRRYGEQAAVVGALVRLGRCIDLLDPSNAILLKSAHREIVDALSLVGQTPRQNANRHKYLDCEVFKFLYAKLGQEGYTVDCSRAVFVPMVPKQGLPRLWSRSGIFENAHIQLCVRAPNNVLAVWSVKKDGTYGSD